jgi:hypothetical protein
MAANPLVYSVDIAAIQFITSVWLVVIKRGVLCVMSERSDAQGATLFVLLQPVPLSKRFC